MSKPQSPFSMQLRLTGSELLHALELLAPDAFKVGFDRQHPQLMDVIVIAKTEAPANKDDANANSVVDIHDRAARLSKQQATALKIVLNNAWLGRSFANSVVDSVNDFLENKPEIVRDQLQQEELASAAGATRQKI